VECEIAFALALERLQETPCDSQGVTSRSGLDTVYFVEMKPMTHINDAYPFPTFPILLVIAALLALLIVVFAGLEYL
jgi:hypothetical protein